MKLHEKLLYQYDLVILYQEYVNLFKIQQLTTGVSLFVEFFY